MDALSDVLRVMRLKGGVFLHGEFSAPWCLSVAIAPESCAPYLGESTHVIPYHYVLDGRMDLRMADGHRLSLEAGDSVMFPRNDDHLLGSDTSLPSVAGRDVVVHAAGELAAIRLGEGPVSARIICGFLGSEDIAGNPVVSALPPVLQFDTRAGSAADWVRSSFHHAAAEIAAGRVGSEVLMSRLSELLFVDAIQRYVSALPDGQTGWLAGLKDRHVARALAMMHADVGRAWTVDDLGREVGLSRSALAERFVTLLGQPPMHYLTAWRLHVAAHELAATSKSIVRIAQQVGYESEASFTRAFKRAMGSPPAAWRRQRQGADAKEKSASPNGPGLRQ